MEPQAAVPVQAPHRAPPFAAGPSLNFAMPGATKFVVLPWLAIPPSLAFWSSLAAAQKAAPIMERKEAIGGENKKNPTRYSSTEEWINTGKSLLLQCGLLAIQAGGALEDRANGSVLSCAFLCVCTTDGTGLLCLVEWPTYGFIGGKGSAGHATASAFTSPWKYYVRGLLAIPQVDPGDELEQRDGSIADYEQQKREAARFQQGQQRSQVATNVHHQFPAQESFAPAENDFAPGAPSFSQGGGFQGQFQQNGFQAPQQQGFQQQAPQQNDAPQRAYQTFGQQAAPQHGFNPQPQRPPIDQEPIVQHTHQMLGGQPARGAENPNTAPPPRPRPHDGGPDPTLEELRAAGWKDPFASQLASIGPNDEVGPDLRDEFMNAVNAYFNGDKNAGYQLWQGTGFLPQGPNGPKPTGAHLRRYCARMNWNAKTATAAAGGQAGRQ